MSLTVYSAVKVALIVAIALASTALLRRQSAALRHWALAAAIVCGAAVPLLELVSPAWNVHVTRPTAVGAVEDSAGANASGSGTPAPARIESAAATPPSGDAASIGVLARRTWMAGTLISLAVLLLGFARLTRLASAARPITDGKWFMLADEIAREYGLSRPVALLRSTHPAMLVTWGVLRPKVLLPAASDHWTDSRIRIVLRHELAHIRRGDWMLQMAAEIVRSVYWFNPLLWIACHRLRLESEHAVDDAVVRRGVDPSDYAAHLLELARAFTAYRRPWSAAPAIARPSSLERRVTAMLNTRVNREPISPAARVGIATGVLAITVAIAGGAFGQTASARFSGTVVDPSGAPLPDTTITLTHRETTVSHAAPTDQTGAFDFTSLAPGEYTIEARTPGFAALTDSITFAAGDTVRRDMRLNIGTVQETITVRGEAAPRNVPERTGPRIQDILAKFRGKRLQPPLKLKDVRPQYSQALRDAGIEGTVVFDSRIATDGSVADLRVVSSAHPELTAAARDAVSQWQFEPTRLWGSPVETAMTVTVNFKRQP